MSFESAAEAQRLRKKMSYKDQLDYDRRQAELNRIKRQQYKDTQPKLREEPRKRKSWSLW